MNTATSPTTRSAALAPWVWGTGSSRPVCARRRLTALAAAVLAAVLWATAASPAPITLHPDNPHYFLWEGRAAVLVTSGEHYGALLNRDFDYATYFATLQADGLNNTLLFSGVYRNHPTLTPYLSTLSPTADRYIGPWPRTQTPGAADGGNKFDLTQWDPAYFARLHDLMLQAQQHGVVVEFVLFSHMGDDSQWLICPLNAASNVNGVGNCPRQEVLTLMHPDVVAAQVALTRKLVQELQGYDHVFLEVCNEPYHPDGATQEWQDLITDTIVEAESGLPKQHAISVNIAQTAVRAEHVHPAVSVLNFHYCYPPDAVAMNYDLARVIGDNETGWRGGADLYYRIEGWEFIVAGGALYNNLDWSFTVDQPDGTYMGYNPVWGGGSPELRRQLGILKRFMDGFDLSRMATASSGAATCSTPGLTLRALSDGDGTYCAYLLSRPPNNATAAVLQQYSATPWTAQVSLALPAGEYRAEWLGTRTGLTAATATVAHAGGYLSLTSPVFTEDLALTVRPVEPPYNAPASRLVITEVNQSTWTSQVQITDLTGGSLVHAYYASGTERRGPFVLWDNTGGPAAASGSFANVLATLDSLDSGDFAYANTSGALELRTQDDEHRIQGAVRTTDTAQGGSNSRTFPALADAEANTAAPGGRQLLIADLSNTTEPDGYRPSVVLFNPSELPVDAQVRLLDSDGDLLTTVSRSLAGLQTDVITTELRAFEYSHATALVAATGGSGRVMASGQTAHNRTGDPAAHLAVQAGAGYPNSPEPRKIISEANWADPWVSEVTLVDVTGGATVEAWYDCSAGGRRGPFTLWENAGGAYTSVTFANILQALEGLDGGFAYEGTSGALEFATQDAAHLIHAAVRTHNRLGRSRTFPALGEQAENTVALGRAMLIPNMSDDATYRCSVVLAKPTAGDMTVEIRVVGSDGAQIGTTVTRTLTEYSMDVVTDPLRAFDFGNAMLRIDAIDGAGYLLVTGQTASNLSQDPAAHIAVLAQ